MVVTERDLLAQDLDKYRGKWVAIKDGEVIASAESAVDVVRELHEKGITDAALHRVSDSPNSAFVL